MDDLDGNMKMNPGGAAVKPVLKQPHNQHHQGQQPSASNTTAASSSPSSGGEDRKKRNTLTWDEHAIEEHDQLRGTRMKIDEPDTPYTHYDHSDDESASSNVSGRHHPRSPDENKTSDPAALATQWDNVSSKLQALADRRDACPNSPGRSVGSCASGLSHDEMDDGESNKKKEMKKLEFEAHRKSHYNEAEAMRRFRQEHANELDEDDDEMM